MMFYEIIEEKFQLLCLDMVPPLSFPGEEICKPLRGLGAAREGVAMDTRWGVKKKQMNGPTQMAFKFRRLSASQVKHHCSQLPELNRMDLAAGHRGATARESEEGGSLARAQLPQCG